MGADTFENTPQDPGFANAQERVLKSLRTKPTEYLVDVIDPDSLPEKMKGRKKIGFIIAPPTLATLTELALILKELPDEVLSDMSMNAKAIEHIPLLTKMIATLAHGDPRKPMPEWYIPFLNDNLTVEEILMIWHETTVKLQTGFFLPFFQSAVLTNPMMMISNRERENLILLTRDLTRTNSSEG